MKNEKMIELSEQAKGTLFSLMKALEQVTPRPTFFGTAKNGVIAILTKGPITPMQAHAICHCISNFVAAGIRLDEIEGTPEKNGDLRQELGYIERQISNQMKPAIVTILPRSE